jgi:hypothetical protein
MDNEELSALLKELTEAVIRAADNVEIIANVLVRAEDKLEGE